MQHLSKLVLFAYALVLFGISCVCWCEDKEKFFDIRSYVFVDDAYSHMVYREKYNGKNAKQDLDFTTYIKKHWLDYNIPKCNFIPLDTVRCIPAICKLKLPHTMYFRQIQGLEQNKCVYYERFLNYGSTTCKVDLDKDLQVISLIDRYHAQQQAISEADAEQIRQFYANNCKVELEGKYTEVIDVGKMYGNPKKTSATDLNYDWYAKNYYESSIAKTQELFNQLSGNQKELQWDLKTIVFSPQKLPLTYEQYDASVISAQRDLYSNSTFNIDRHLLSLNKIQINTIVIINQNQWAIWINGMKLDNLSQDSNLKVLNITENSAKLEWHIKDISAISPNWRQYFTQQDEDIYLHDTKRFYLKHLSDDSYDMFVELKLGEYLKLSDFKIIDENNDVAQ